MMLRQWRLEFFIGFSVYKKGHITLKFREYITIVIDLIYKGMDVSLDERPHNLIVYVSLPNEVDMCMPFGYNLLNRYDVF